MELVVEVNALLNFFPDNKFGISNLLCKSMYV